MPRRVRIKIRRQKEPGKVSYWQEYKVPIDNEKTVFDLLKTLSGGSDHQEGKIEWDGECGKETCGKCSMLINGIARLACKTFISKLKQPISLEPLSKFPVIKDLKIDKSSVTSILEKLKLDDKGDNSNCILCACCLESCPSFNSRTKFVGAFAIAKAISIKDSYVYDRYLMLMSNGGVSDCGNAGNCEVVCPKRIRLKDAIAKMNWEITKFSIKNYFHG